MNHDLGWYCKYYGDTWGSKTVNQIRFWIWGGYGTAMGNTSQEVGYGLQNTKNYLANTVNATNGTASENFEYPSLYRGLNDFRNAHGDKWFLPSMMELALVYSTGLYRSLTFDASTGASSNKSGFWSSSEYSANVVYAVTLGRDEVYNDVKSRSNSCVRLCRAF